MIKNIDILKQNDEELNQKIKNQEIQIKDLSVKKSNPKPDDNDSLEKKIIRILEDDKTYYETKVKTFPEEDKVPKESLENYKQSSLTSKAMNLLNNESFGKMFSTGSNIPCEDVINIYLLYFNIINHPLKKEKRREVFWQECCNYFRNNSQEKLGDFITKTIQQQIVECENNFSCFSFFIFVFCCFSSFCLSFYFFFCLIFCLFFVFFSQQFFISQSYSLSVLFFPNSIA